MSLKKLHICLLLTLLLMLSGQNAPRIKGDMPLWQRYMENSRNIKNGAAFIPLAVRMVIEQLGVTDHDDLYNLDIQIHLAMKDMAFFRGFAEGSADFKNVVNQTARRGDRIEMSIHPDRKTIDLHVFGEIITFDVFDIKLKTLKWKDIAPSVLKPDEELKIVAVIGEESLIVEKNFGVREIEQEVEEVEFETAEIIEETKAPKTLKPVFYYRENFFDLTASVYQAENHLEADIYATHTLVDNDEKSIFYRYLLGVVDDAILPQLEFGAAWKYNGLFFASTVNGGYNTQNNSLLFGIKGGISQGNIGLIAENNYFNIGDEVYEKNDLKLTPCLTVSTYYDLPEISRISAGVIYLQNQTGVTLGLASPDFSLQKMIKTTVSPGNSFVTGSSFNLEIDAEYYPTGEVLNWKSGLNYNYHLGKTTKTQLNSFQRSNRKAFSTL